MKIMLAVNDTPSSDEVVDSIFSGNWPGDISFKVVTVLEPVCVSFEDLTISEFSETAGEIYARRKESAQHLCERICQKIELALPQAIVSYEIKEGAPWAEIVRAAAEWSADSIIVGVHGRDICPTNRTSSVGRAVVEHALCSVSVVSSADSTEHATATLPANAN